MKTMAAVVISVGLLVSAPRGSLAAPAREFSWQGPIAAGKTLDLRGIHGPIHAVRAAGREAVVRAVKTARRGDPDAVRIETYRDDGDVYFCALYPGHTAGSPNPCAGIEGRGRSSSRQDDPVEVAWEVEVPAGVRLVARTVNGDVEIAELAGPVEATTVNGSIDLATRDEAEATTVNGSIEARLGAGRLTRDLSFRTVNGSVVLRLADGIGAEVRAESMHGEFASDFPVTVEGRLRRNRVRGTIGGGGPLLSMATVNGSIELRRQSSASK
jgi:hypothetical protein